MTTDDWLPDPVMVAKFKILFDQGYRPEGVLLSSAAEPHRLVGVTGDGKVAWWPATAPEPDESIRMMLDWLETEEGGIPGAFLHLGMAGATIRRLQGLITILQSEVVHHKRVADHLLERDYRGEQQE